MNLYLPAAESGVRYPLDRLESFPRWLVLLCVALAARFVTFGNPLIHVDEQFYFLTAMEMRDGAVPFVDIWDRKPIGLFLVYFPAALLGVPLGIWAYQLMAVACVVATAWIITLIADHAGWRRGALLAAILYILMLGFADGQGGQSPVFYNLLIAAAVWLLLPRAGDDSAGIHGRRMLRSSAAMLLVGVALQIKYSVVFEGAFLGIWLLWREWQLRPSPTRFLVRTAFWGSLAWVPTLAAWAAYAAMGLEDAWVYANFTSILDRQSDPFLALVGAFLHVSLILMVPLILVGLSRHIAPESAQTKEVRTFLFGWLGAALAGLILFGSWFTHYALPVLLPACLCAAAYLGGTHAGRKWVAPALLLVGFVGSQALILHTIANRGTTAELEQLAAAVGTGDGCLYVHSGNTILYSYTGRCTLSAWVFPSHLSRARERDAVGVDQLVEVERIFSERPAVVTMRPEYKGERLEVRQLTHRLLQENGYRLKGTYPVGNELNSVYALADTRAADARPDLASTRP